MDKSKTYLLGPTKTYMLFINKLKIESPQNSRSYKFSRNKGQRIFQLFLYLIRKWGKPTNSYRTKLFNEK